MLCGTSLDSIAMVELAYWIMVLIVVFLGIRIIIYALTQFAKGLAEVVEVDIHRNQV